LERFAKPLVGLPVSHVWRGYGSSLFLEFGKLTPSRVVQKQGSKGNPTGQMGLMIEWSWRIEKARSIVCGSWSDEKRLSKAFGSLVGTKVTELHLFARLPEISVGLSNGTYVTSFMTAEGQPQWALFDRRSADHSWLTVERGRPVERHGSK
jgi:hypothetical protein